MGDTWVPTYALRSVWYIMVDPRLTTLKRATTGVPHHFEAQLRAKRYAMHVRAWPEAVQGAKIAADVMSLQCRQMAFSAGLAGVSTIFEPLGVSQDRSMWCKVVEYLRVAQVREQNRAD